MKRRVIGGLALLCATVSVEAATAQSRHVIRRDQWVPRAADRVPTEFGPCGFPTTTFYGQYIEGRELNRQDPMSYVREVAYGAPSSVAAVQCAAARLRTYYAARAGRQQTNLDLGAAGVVTGAIGNLASAGAGAATQAAWGYAGLAPVLLAEINANEPTRDLFYGGALALDLVTARYAELASAASAPARPLAGRGRTEACDALAGEVAASGRWEREDGGSSVKDDAQAVLKVCKLLDDSDQDAGAFAAAETQWRNNLARLYAADVLLIESAVTARDHELRFSPVETLQNIAAAPFQVVGRLLSGEDGRAAVKKLQTVRTFQALDMTLSEIQDPPAYGDPAGLELSTTTRARAASGSPPALRAAAVRTRDAAALLNREMRSRRYAAQTTNRAVIAARSNRLKFNYDAASARASVALAPPPESKGVTPTTTADGASGANP